MLTVAYLANQFPSAVEHYVGEEIQELRRRGVRVIPGSVRTPAHGTVRETCAPEIVLQPFRAAILAQALLLCLRKWNRISPLLGRILLQGSEGPVERIKALLHTWMGACYAFRLRGHSISHIHVHHGYFGAWIALTAARLLDTGFSMTLHGSDLLLRAAYLDTKLANCNFCLTVSEYNRRYIIRRYPEVGPQRVLVSRLGVEIIDSRHSPDIGRETHDEEFALLAVGRLCAVKDHAFLVLACARLRDHGVKFNCSIGGDGPERHRLDALIRKHRLEQHVRLLGHVAHEQVGALYDRADVVVLTSRSEGIPLVLMEAMARGRIVLAPAITGIPELVIPGQTGFLYQPGSLDGFVNCLLHLHSLTEARKNPHRYPAHIVAVRQLDWMRHAARMHVRHNFNRRKNLESFAERFIARIAPQTESLPHENFVLQQI